MKETILFIGPHPDDIEISCGGSLSYFSKEYYTVCIYLTKGEMGGDPIIREEESKLSCDILGADKIIFGNFRDTCIPYNIETISFLEQQYNRYKPSIIFIPSSKDSHQDHRKTNLSCKAAFRKANRILEYETSSVDNNYNPVFFIDISEFIEIKEKALKMHKTQMHKNAMDYKAIINLSSFRGRQVNVNNAEAFEIVKYLYDNYSNTST